MKLHRLLLPIVFVAAAAFATTASAEPQNLAGGYFVGAFPMGDWGDVAGFGLALDATDIVKPKRDKAFGVRTNLGILYNFSRTVDVPSANLQPNDDLSIETKNWSVFFGVGPELSAPNKTVTPFIFGTAGFDTYWTKSELAGTANGLSYSAQHGDSRMSFAWSGGVGIRRELAPGHLVELSGEYRSGLDHDYLLPTNVTNSGTAVQATRTRNTSDELLIRLGTVFGD
jgi:hypothetical protein